ncbi:MAG: glycosyltransferase family protein [Planctomycetes bacterium]|nr:glycosyltransferase family protein [Planctomycetota bacterium]
MGSTRLPGKVMREICERAMVMHVIDRVRQVQAIDSICLACTDNSADDILVSLVRRQSDVTIFGGSEHDVLDRYYQAAVMMEADVIIRITADCPLISPEVINQVLETYLSAADDYDYVSNTLIRSFPHGLDCEIISMETLSLIHNEAREKADREHVMPFLWRQPDRFRLKNIVYEKDLSHYRWTVDTAEDLQLVQKIYNTLYVGNNAFEWHDARLLIEEHPEWLDINKHIQQKKYGE